MVRVRIFPEGKVNGLKVSPVKVQDILHELPSELIGCYTLVEVSM